ncbi:MAG: oxidoreductase [bacterium]|nr:oxidoreductase [bacterium]
MSRSALLLGATGLIGGCVLDYLLADESYEKITTIGRRKIEGREHRKLTQIIADLDTMLGLPDDPKQLPSGASKDLQELSAAFSASEIFCTLGTTMKKAGSKAAFEKVDYHAPLKAAGLGIARGAKQFLIVTALGADAKSAIYYNQVKGRVEDALLQHQFHSIHIFQPSLLTGDRGESRLGEDIGKAVGGVLGLAMIGPLKKYKPIPGRTVARAMLAAARKADSGVHSYESDTIYEMAP